MKNYINQNILVTTNDWFTAPDGKEYKAVYGLLKGVHEAKDQFGFIPNRTHTNWFLEIGNMVIMGCRVMYVVRCGQIPQLGETMCWTVKDGVKVEYSRPTIIYHSHD